MADSFTFTDRIQAVLAGCACLNCFSATHLDDHLSADEADTLSLHSQFAGSQRSHYEPKHMSLFGWDIFGQRTRIRLTDSDDEEDGVSLFRTRSKSRHRRDQDPGAESTSTFDSDADAAPLDPALINARAAEEAERRQKELEKAERRRLRRERKELKRMAMAGSLQDSGEFEGFPGSGASDINRTAPLPHPPMNARLPEPAGHDADDGDDVDLDGGVYLGQTSSRVGSRSNSDSRSRSSASRSSEGAQYAFYNHQHQTTPRNSKPAIQSQAPLTNKRSKRSSKSIQSSSSATASVSLPSPKPTDDRGFLPFIHEGDKHDEDDNYDSRFPSVGLAGAPPIERKGSLRDQGGILAQSGF